MKYDYSKAAQLLADHYNDTNYCGVIAHIAVTGCSVGKAYHDLRRHGRKARQSTSLDSLKLALACHGLVSEQVFKARYKSELKTFSQTVRRLPKSGKYLIRTRTHITAVIDGHIHDWMSDSRRHKVYEIYKVETA